MGNVETSETNGIPVIKIQAGDFEARIIPDIGANVISLTNCENGLDILRSPENISDLKKRPELYGIPILLLPNRIEDGHMRVAGHSYQLPINDRFNNHIHGFLHSQPWSILEEKKTRDASVVIQLAFSHTPEHHSFLYFPHRFIAHAVYTLAGKGLKQIIKIENKGEAPMPFALGCHTAFNVPFSAGSRSKDVKLKISLGRRIDLNDRFLPTGRFSELTKHELRFRKNGNSPVVDPLSAHFTIDPILLNGKSFYGAILYDDSVDHAVVYATDSAFKYWVLWNEGGNNDYVYIEPQTWMINAPNLNLSTVETGMRVLRPREYMEFQSSIYVCKKEEFLTG